MSAYHSQFRGDIATFPAGKVNGDDFPSDLVNHPYTAFHESGDGHKGKPVGTVSYSGGEFICRVSVGQRDFYFRSLDLAGVKDQVRRHFNAARDAIQFKLDRTAWLAKDGERAALLKV